MSRLFRVLFLTGMVALVSGCFHIQLTSSVGGATITITPLRDSGNALATGSSATPQY